MMRNAQGGLPFRLACVADLRRFRILSKPCKYNWITGKSVVKYRSVPAKKSRG